VFDSDAADVARRDFLQRAGRRGIVVGAAVWAGPVVVTKSVAMAAGSPPPGGTTGGSTGGSTGGTTGGTTGATTGNIPSTTGGTTTGTSGGTTGTGGAPVVLGETQTPPSGGTAAPAVGGQGSTPGRSGGGILAFTGIDPRRLLAAAAASAVAGGTMVAATRERHPELAVVDIIEAEAEPPA